MKKNVLLIGVFLSCACFLFGQGGAEKSKGGATLSSKKIVMNIGSAVSDTNPSTIALQSFKKNVEERTKGAVEVNIYANSALGSEQDMISQLISGTLEGSMQMGAANWESYNEEADVALLPFLWTDIDDARNAWNGDFGKRFAEEVIEPTGCKVLSIWESGFRHMTNNKRPIVEPEDIKGIKFRTNNNNMKTQMFGALDGSVIMMSFSEVFSALQNGTIDGQENPLANIYTSSIQEVQKYLSLTGHMYDAAPLVCSMKWWNTLPAEYQQILLEEAANARKIDLAENDESKFLDLLKKSGIAVNDVDRTAFQAKMQPVWEKFTTKFGQDWITLAQKDNKTK
jgi:tripartite ATP-independent transporter DctP family solute receptor